MLRKALLASAFALATAPVVAQAPQMFAQSDGASGSTMTSGSAQSGQAHHSAAHGTTRQDAASGSMQHSGSTHHSGAAHQGMTHAQTGSATGGAGDHASVSHAMHQGGMVAVTPMDAPATDAYLRKTASTDLYEIESGRLALERSQSAQVRQFAQAMIDHHGQTSAMLKQAAAQAGSAPAPQMDPAHQAMLKALRDAPAGEFDSLYLRQQITGHMNNLAIQAGYASEGQSQPLRQVAMAATPVVQSHLDAAWSMSEIPQTMARHRQQDEQRFAALDTASGRRDSRGYTVLGPSAWGDTAMADARTDATYRGYTTGSAAAGTTTTGATPGTASTGAGTGGVGTGVTSSGATTGTSTAGTGTAAAGMAADTASGRADQQFGVSGPGSPADALRTGTSVNAQPGVSTGVDSTSPTGGSGTTTGTTGSGEDEGGDPPTGD